MITIIIKVFVLLENYKNDSEFSSKKLNDKNANLNYQREYFNIQKLPGNVHTQRYLLRILNFYNYKRKEY